MLKNLCNPSKSQNIAKQRVVLVLVGVILCLVAMGCASSPSPEVKASSGTIIGVVDTQRLLETTKVGKQVTAMLNDFMKDRQALIDLEQKELRKLENELLRQGSVLSQAAKQQREEQFRKRMLEYQRKVSGMNQEVQEKQAELFAEFRASVEKVAAKVAQKRGLIIVLEKGPNSSTRYYHSSLDISDEVQQEMNNDFGK